MVPSHRYSLIALALLALLVIGCPASNRTPTKQPPAPEKPTPADSAQSAPEDDEGWLFDAKEQFHLLLKVDAAKKEARVRILDDAAKEDVPLKADSLTMTVKNGKPHQFELKAERKPGQKETAFFAGANDRLGEKLDPAKVEISTDIRGKNYIFTLDTDHKEKRGKK